MFACLLLAAAPAAAEHVVAVGVEADTEDSKSFSLMGSFGLTGNTWLNAGLTRSRSPNEPFDLDTTHADLGLDYFFDPIGVRVGLAYWGDEELLDSNDVSAALYWRNDRASVTLDVERRSFDLTIRSLLLDEPRFVEFEADGVGLAARAELSDAVSIYASGMQYDYSRDISLTPNVDVLRIFAVSRLSMMYSLLDERYAAGLEFSFGERVVDVRASAWETAVFGDRVESVGIGLLTPLGHASDLELRLETDSTDTAGRATLFSVFLYFYGE